MEKNIQMIQNENLIVQVNMLGASLWSIKDCEGVEYLWQGDEKYWGDRAPNLFPYIARLTKGRYILGEQEYEMDIHGFAKDSVFEVVKISESELVLRLEDSEETYKQYPYHFSLDIIYTLNGKRLDVTFHVENKDEKQMYFGIGGHPGFHVPLEKGEKFEDYYLEFSDECVPKKVLFSEDCFVLGKTTEFPLKDGARLPLRHDLFDDDAIILTDMPRAVTLKSVYGKRAVKVSYPEMDYLGLWHWPRTDAPYLCIEPWSSLPSRKDIIEDLAKQTNLKTLKSKDVLDNCWSIEIINN